jgi:hypothetical protein
MKTTLAIACLIGLSFGISGIPAHAFNISIGDYDRNHDGRWDRQEYYNAQSDWHRYNDHRYWGRTEAYRHFDQYDVNHDGYLNGPEVLRIQSW